MSTVTSPQLRDPLRAFVVINRLQATIPYNIGYVLIGVTIGIAQTTLDTRTLTIIGWYAVGMMLLKMQASVADAIHDREVDATNPEKSIIAWAVDELGVRTAWSILVAELVVGLLLCGYVSVRTGTFIYLIAGGIFAILGFCYSYPPRLKEQNALNHLVTTGTDVGLFVLLVAYIAVGTVILPMVVISVVVFCYTFAYHILHQAADTHYDLKADVETFVTRIGVEPATGLAVAGNAVATLVAGWFGYTLAALVLGGMTGFYAWLFVRLRGRSLQTQSDLIARRFGIGWVATLLNLGVAASILFL